jgi:hypothetical protein
VSDGFVADEFYSRKKGAFDDSRGTENGALPGDDVGGSINSLDLLFRDPFDFPGLGLGVGKPHAELDLAPECAEGCSGEDAFWRSTDPHIEVNARIREGGGDRSGDIAIGDCTERSSGSTDGINEGLVAGTIEDEDHEIPDTLLQNFCHTVESFLQRGIQKVGLGIFFLQDAGHRGSVGNFVGIITRDIPHDGFG